MDSFERDLAKALRRREPPVDLSARVWARITREQERGAWWRVVLAGYAWRWAVAAVLLVAVVGTPFAYVQRQERQRAAGEAARQQVLLALRIAGSKMQIAQREVQQVSAKEGIER